MCKVRAQCKIYRHMHNLLGTEHSMDLFPESLLVLLVDNTVLHGSVSNNQDSSKQTSNHRRRKGRMEDRL